LITDSDYPFVSSNSVFRGEWEFVQMRRIWVFKSKFFERRGYRKLLNKVHSD
jgi:hypothetical protein